ncbi:hypothetical protein ACVWXM_000554 [Bradyrhizobium sp. GM7.3]
MTLESNPGVPPRRNIQDRQHAVERDLAEPARDCQQDRRQRWVDELEVLVDIAGIERPTLQDLLPGPVPQAVVLGLAVPEDLGTKDIGSQDEAAEQEEQVEWRTQRQGSECAGSNERFR